MGVLPWSQPPIPVYRLGSRDQWFEEFLAQGRSSSESKHAVPEDTPGGDEGDQGQLFCRSCCLIQKCYQLILVQLPFPAV